MGVNSYAWDYDPIGNREFFTENGTTLDYLSNQLNQYTNIANGVTLTPEYDSDGNMTNYNGWAYQWNGENRLRVAADGSTTVTNKYDYMGRRISKSVDGVETKFLYDGWNLVQETTGTNVTQYVWGLDLSQSLQGAGGVGGLLCVIENGEEYFPCYDANGNITEYVDSTGTNVVAHYEYSAFGRITASNGTKADDFAFRFSTKYYDTEAGLYAYGMRYYNPALGRWINRDPIGERGGVHLYGFVNNGTICLIDVSGRFSYSPLPGTGVPYKPKPPQAPSKRPGDPPWNQRDDVSQGFDIVELSGFDVIGGGLKFNIGLCCENEEKMKFVKAEGCFGLGGGKKLKLFKIKNIQKALKASAKAKDFSDALFEADKQCPREGFDMDIKVSGMLGIYKAEYSFLGDILNIIPGQGSGHGVGSKGPEIGWGIEGSIQVCLGWVWVF